MDKANKLPTERGSTDILDTKDLAAALPESKEKETRPKYVQVLQDKSGQRPLGGPTPSTTDAPASTKKGPRKQFQKFNNNQKNRTSDPNGKQPFRVYLKKQEVTPLPAGLPTRDLSVAPDNVHCFSGPNNYLSALYPSKFIVDGNSYNSVEHYYQACKLYDLIGQETAAQLKTAATPIEVKKMTKNFLKGKVAPKAVSEWKATNSIPVLKYAVTEKFAQNNDLKEALLNTENKILIQTYIGDNFYAVGAGYKFTTGWVIRHVNQSLKVPEEVSTENVKYLPLIANGKNVLGWILMQVREELRAK